MSSVADSQDLQNTAPFENQYLQPFQILIGMINLITLIYDQYKLIYKISYTFSLIKVMSINMPKIYSYDFKISVINFYYSKFWNITYALHIFNASKSTIYNWISLHKNDLLFPISNLRSSYNR